MKSSSCVISYTVNHAVMQRSSNTRKKEHCDAEKTFVKGMDPIVSKHILDHSFNRSRDKERLRRRGEVFRLVFAESGVRKSGSRMVRFQLLCVFEK